MISVSAGSVVPSAGDRSTIAGPSASIEKLHVLDGVPRDVHHLEAHRLRPGRQILRRRVSDLVRQNTRVDLRERRDIRAIDPESRLRGINAAASRGAGISRTSH